MKIERAETEFLRARIWSVSKLPKTIESRAFENSSAHRWQLKNRPKAAN